MWKSHTTNIFSLFRPMRIIHVCENPILPPSLSLFRPMRNIHGCENPSYHHRCLCSALCASYMCVKPHPTTMFVFVPPYAHHTCVWNHILPPCLSLFRPMRIIHVCENPILPPSLSLFRPMRIIQGCENPILPFMSSFRHMRIIHGYSTHWMCLTECITKALRTRKWLKVEGF